MILRAPMYVIRSSMQHFLSNRWFTAIVTLLSQESIPNEYSRLYQYPSNTPMQATPPDPRPSCQSAAKLPKGPESYIHVYDIPCDASRHGEVMGDNDYDTASLPSHGHGEEMMETYNYVPRVRNAKDYDYESPYWAPSSDRSKLLEQFRKLQIPSVSQKELE